MKLSAIFPNASQSCQKANPQLGLGGRAKNALAGNVERKRGIPNKTEAEFALRLEAMKQAGEIYYWRFESIKLKLADQCWYTPDFFVEREDKPLFIEIKGGHIWDDSKVKFKTATELHRWADFELWQKQKTGWKRLY